jgi:hypothetical protein
VRFSSKEASARKERNSKTLQVILWGKTKGDQLPIVGHEDKRIR